ncbi:MAG: hypothetical protein IID08_05885 [Candidatus Hydrogenedentes bacterium]|nr:hypothetical protein [Candidatus Hydrogenedentota bacterium]
MDTDSKTLVPPRLFLVTWLVGVVAFLMVVFLLSRFGMTFMESLERDTPPAQTLEETEAER